MLLITINIAIADTNGINPQQTTDHHNNTFGLSSFDNHDINTILKRGNSREKQLVIEYLIKERHNPEKLDLLISYYIHNDRNDLAKYWVTWGEDNNIKIKSWQKLHLAIIQKDKKTINHILANENNNLPETMINDALIILNKDDKALSSAHSYIDHINQYHNNKALQYQVKATVFSENYGALDIESTNITGKIKIGKNSINIAGMKNRINTEEGNIYQNENIEDELDVSIIASKRINDNIFSIGIGNNHRKSDDITYALLKYEYEYNDVINGVLALDYNKITYTSPALRALGYNNKVSLGLSFKPEIDYILNLNLNLHEYKTRNNDAIGSGYGIIASLSHILSFTPSYLDVSIRTSLEDNNLKSSIASYIATDQIVQPDDIIADDYGFIGFGAVYKYGFLDGSRYLTNNFSINAYTGLIFPDESVNYGIDIKYGYAHTPLSLLGLDAVYSNAFNNIKDNDYTKLTLYYKHHF
jgi:hypothetical protein